MGFAGHNSQQTKLGRILINNLSNYAEWKEYIINTSLQVTIFGSAQPNKYYTPPLKKPWPLFFFFFFFSHHNINIEEQLKQTSGWVLKLINFETEYEVDLLLWKSDTSHVVTFSSFITTSLINNPEDINAITIIILGWFKISN